MRCEVVALREDGWLLPRFRSCMHRAVVGDLVLREAFDPQLRRTVRRAALLDLATGRELAAPAPLFDARVVAIDRECFTITGFEREHDALLDRYRDIAQSWYCVPGERSASDAELLKTAMGPVREETQP